MNNYDLMKARDFGDTDFDSYDKNELDNTIKTMDAILEEFKNGNVTIKQFKKYHELCPHLDGLLSKEERTYFKKYEEKSSINNELRNNRYNELWNVLNEVVTDKYIASDDSIIGKCFKESRPLGDEEHELDYDEYIKVLDYIRKENSYINVKTCCVVYYKKSQTFSITVHEHYDLFLTDIIFSEISADEFNAKLTEAMKWLNDCVIN